MTNAEKGMILIMREQCKSYKSIADELHMSINTVKSFVLRRVKRHETLTLEHQESSSYRQCKQCGITLPLKQHHKARIFCSDRCRYIWWNAHRIKKTEAVEKRDSAVDADVQVFEMNIGTRSSGQHWPINRTAKYAGAPSMPIKGGITPVPVMVRPVPRKRVWFMDKVIIDYSSAIAQARRMLKLSIISLDDYQKIDHVLLEKYKLPLSSLYRDIVLIFMENRGNMPH